MAKRRKRGYDLETKHWGLEPVFEPGAAIEDLNILASYSWYNYNASDAKRKTWLLEWMKENAYTPKDISLVKRNSKIDRAGTVARMLSRGAPMPEWEKTSLRESIAEYIQIGKEKRETSQKKVVKTVQDYLNDYVNAIIGDLEPVIDTIMETGKFPTGFKLEKDIFGRDKFKAIHAKRLAAHFEPVVAELTAASVVRGPNVDAFLRESYDFMPLKTLKAATKKIQKIIDDCNAWAGFNKPARVSKKKPVKQSVDKKVSLLKFKDKDATYKIQSIDPRTILGASILYTFNTKNRILTILETDEPDGLNVHRSSVTGWNPKLSSTRRIRKPEEVLPTVAKKGKRAIGNLLKDLSTKPRAARGNINSHMVLLQVIK